MDKLKQELFRTALYHRRQCQRLVTALGEWDSLVDMERAKFKALYDVIVEAELENEYLRWTKKQEATV